jgi:hypothetical protein
MQELVRLRGESTSVFVEDKAKAKGRLPVSHLSLTRQRSAEGQDAKLRVLEAELLRTKTEMERKDSRLAQMQSDLEKEKKHKKAPNKTNALTAAQLKKQTASAVKEAIKSLQKPPMTQQGDCSLTSSPTVSRSMRWSFPSSVDGGDPHTVLESPEAPSAEACSARRSPLSLTRGCSVCATHLAG